MCRIARAFVTLTGCIALTGCGNLEVKSPPAPRSTVIVEKSSYPAPSIRAGAATAGESAADGKIGSGQSSTGSVLVSGGNGVTRWATVGDSGGDGIPDLVVKDALIAAEAPGRKQGDAGMPAADRLAMDGTQPVCANGKAGIGSDAPAGMLNICGLAPVSVRKVAVDTTLSNADCVCVATASVSITLPDPATCAGRIYTIKAAEAGTTSRVLPQQGRLLGGSDQPISVSFPGALTVVSDGENNFYVVGR